MPRRIVCRSRSACVGCWCLPSPAFTTRASVTRATNCAAPDLGVAQHDHVGVVRGQRQRRVLQRLALVDGRADGLQRHRVGRQPLRGELERRARCASTTRRRRSGRAGRAASAASCCRAPGSARTTVRVASRRSTSSRVRSRDRQQVAAGRPPAAAGRPRRHEDRSTSASSRSEIEHHAVDLVDLDQLDLHALAARRRQVLADVVGPDRQLAVAAVGEHGELHAVGAPDTRRARRSRRESCGRCRARRRRGSPFGPRARSRASCRARAAARGAAPARRARARRRGGR